VPPERARAFAPGRVNLIGEHTDYNEGLALPFAIGEGITVTAQACDGDGRGEQGARLEVLALDLDERDEFAVAEPDPPHGWRAYVRGVAAELARAGSPPPCARVEIHGDLPRGAGLSSSAALEVALCLALTELARASSGAPPQPPDRIALAKLCARVENDWVGARTGMLDQLACLYGAPDTAVRIDFRTLDVQPVALSLDGWRLAVLDSGERHANASSGYNERRAECARACELLGITSLRDADIDAVSRLPEPLARRARHVLEENARVERTVAALRDGDLVAVGSLLDESHRSLRDLYEVSTAAVEETVARLRDAGAAGARLVGGGFGGSVLGLLAPGVNVPREAREVHPGPGAHLLDAV